MKKLYTVFIAIMLICLTGCFSLNGFNSKKLVEKLTEEGISQNAIDEYDRDLYDEIYIHDNDLGHARIYVYKKASDAQDYWDNLSERYNNLKYLDDETAIGDLKEVYDASIEEWIHLDGNVIVSAQQCVANEWAIYTGEDGEEYYGDGTKVSEVETADEQRDKATELENRILNCLR